MTTAPSLGGLIISLDFELMWGVRASTTIDRYGANILGARTVIPKLLDLFGRHELAATWATVGFLFFEEKDALIAATPDHLPRYADPHLSPYPDLKTIGRNERDDPYHFGLSLVREIKSRPRQEIGTHTFSHFFCLQADPDEAAFRADLDAANQAAAAEDVRLESIVFPRNQVRKAYLATCRDMGLAVFRGTEQHWLYRPVGEEGESLVRRGVRLADSYLNLSGQHHADPSIEADLVNLPSSRFLRPYAKRLSSGHALKRRRIIQAMRKAAARGAFYHLWFHPHNFGTDQDQNLALMEEIALEATRLRERYGWGSLTMADAARAASSASTSAGPDAGRSGQKSFQTLASAER